MPARADDMGFFWQDIKATRGSDENRPRPTVPETGWEPPRTFPNLSSAIMLSLDTETYDPELKVSGPGWARKRGHIVGVSIGAKDARGNIGGWYFPIRHEDTPQDNMDPETVLNWLRLQLGDARPKFGANLIYDLGWLAEENIIVNGKLFDVQHAESLISETARVDLDSLAAKYLGGHKESSLLYQWCSDAFGGKPNGGQRANIYRSPPSLVGPYAEADATLPLRIIEKQWPELARQELSEVFAMEEGLIPLMVAMRQEGVSVDVDLAEQLYYSMGEERKAMLLELRDLIGFEINVASGDDLRKAFDKHGLKYGFTAKGTASFTAGFLESVQHPIGRKVVEIRQRDKLRDTFIKSYILGNHVDGKVYGSFNQLRGESYGTRSGRFSSSLPNLQNIPVRSELGARMRELFIPDKGHATWRKYDYSQIEYRFLGHYALGVGSDDIRARYNADPETDYHDETGALISRLTGLDLKRGAVKTVNFGTIYGLGELSLATDLGLSLHKAREFLRQYHQGLPFVKTTVKDTQDFVAEYGYVKTIMGRRTYFDTWEQIAYGKSPGRPLPLEEALAAYGNNIRRADTNKAFNRKLQGSAADLMKKAMLKNWDDGVFAETGVPRLTVHDELDFSDPGGLDKAFLEMRHNLETAIPLKVPVLADYESGPNWGKVKEQ